MALVACHECHKEISTEAKTCPNCGAPPKQVTAYEAAATGAEPTKKTSDSHKASLVLLGLALFVVGCVVVSSRNVAPPAIGQESAYSACTMAQRFVKDRLRAPATADFQTCADGARGLGNGMWYVVGTVDSENGFGAKIRSQYRADLVYAGDNEWRLTKVDIK